MFVTSKKAVFIKKRFAIPSIVRIYYVLIVSIQNQSSFRNTKNLSCLLLLNVIEGEMVTYTTDTESKQDMKKYYIHRTILHTQCAKQIN